MVFVFLGATKELIVKARKVTQVIYEQEVNALWLWFGIAQEI